MNHRVLHVSQSVDTGVAHVVADLAKAQLRAGWDVVVACPGGRLAELCAAAGAIVVPWAARRVPGPSVPVEMLRLRQVLHRARPDMVHLHSAKAGLVGRMVLQGRLPTVYTPHAWSWLAVTGRVRQAAIRWERQAAEWAHAIVCVSPTEAAEGRLVGITEPVRVIPNDVDADRLRAVAPPSRAAARRQLGIEAETLLAACCARLAPQKGQDVLLTAWPAVRNRVRDVELVLVGDGPNRSYLAEAAAQIPGVRLVGMQDRVQTLAWMTAADVVVCPSRYEGMSLVPLEAAALGRVVVGSDVEGMRTGPGRRSRWLVPPEDAGALGETLGDLLADSQTRVEAGERAAREVDARSGGSSHDALLAVYEELLAVPEPTPLPVLRRAS